MASESNTFLVNFMNVALGAAVIVCLLSIAVIAVCATTSRVLRMRGHRAGLDRELQEMFGPMPGNHRR